MKKILFLLIPLTIALQAFSQQASHIKGKAVGFSFFMNDFQTASDIRSMGLIDVLNDGNFFKTSKMNSGLAVNYLQGLSKHMDLAATLGGSLLKYPINGVPAFTNSKLYLETTASINFKLLSDNYAVTPYIDLGVGVSKFDKYFGAFIPAGVGLQVNFGDEVFLLLNSQYRIAVTDKASYHFYHSLGVATTFSGNKVEKPKEVEIPVVLDRDGDGVVDSLDRCPDEPGLASLQGCPDRDGDGIADIDDACPDVPGVAKYKGCPIPDRDNDGINDEEDKCPDVPGVARYQGCPVPDSDGDGVNDEEDKCPHEVGPASNQGCPVIDVKTVEKINKAAQNIYFNIGSHKLLGKSFTSLNEVVQILKENPSYKISIDGYTDNTGSDEINKKLSGERANSVKEYLVKNSLDESRITAVGHGTEDPIADNATAAGRSKNRRVEMKLTNY